MPADTSIRIYISRINKVLGFKIEDGHKLEIQTPETMKLFGSTKNVNRKTKE